MPSSHPASLPPIPPPGRMRWLWFAAGWLCFAVGAIGVALPGIPTTGPMLLALACFARSSPRFHRWLYEHRTFGPPLQRWHRYRMIPLRVKIIALSTMAASLCGLLWVGSLPGWALAAVAALMLVGAIFILSQPHRMPEGAQTPDAQIPDEP